MASATGFQRDYVPLAGCRVDRGKRVPSEHFGEAESDPQDINQNEHGLRQQLLRRLRLRVSAPAVPPTAASSLPSQTLRADRL